MGRRAWPARCAGAPGGGLLRAAGAAQGSGGGLHKQARGEDRVDGCAVRGALALLSACCLALARADNRVLGQRCLESVLTLPVTRACLHVPAPPGLGTGLGHEPADQLLPCTPHAPCRFEAEGLESSLVHDTSDVLACVLHYDFIADHRKKEDTAVEAARRLLELREK